MAWYSAGTITATNNNSVITGAGTAFLANVCVGDGITIAGSTTIHEVTNVASDTQLTINPVYPGTTGASKTYAAVPVQGYVKSLADQAKQLILTFSTVGAASSVNALAGITGAADQLPYFTSGTTMWTTPFSATARSLLDDPSFAAMRSSLGLKTAAVADILGTVAQTGGVPTGSIIERGSNVNGEYVKFADGTLICTLFQTITANLNTTGYGSGAYTSYAWTFPINCYSAPALSVMAVIPGRIVLCGTTSNNATNSCSVFFWDAYGAVTGSMYTRWLAIGRWF